MNEILRDILMIVGGLVAGVLFTIIKNKIFKTTKNVIVAVKEEDKTKLKEFYDRGLISEKVYKETCTNIEPTECFNKDKLITGLTKINSATLWAKDFASIFNLRKLIIVGVIIGVIFGYGYYRGQMGKPVVIDWRGKEEFVKLNEHYLHIQKDGSMQVLDKDKKTILKDIKVKDLDSLRKYLKPYGLKLEPIVVAGGSLGQTGAGFEGGVGVSWLKYFKWNVDSFITNRALYPLGASYQITDNSGVGLGAGIGFKGDKRVILYYKWKF